MKSLPAARGRIYDAALRVFTERGTTQTNVSELAHAAGLARGTIYNNIPNLDSLFEEVATALANEMHERVLASFGAIEDPALRLSCGIRFFVRRGHEEPPWGRFIVRFAFTSATLQSMLAGPTARDLQNGLDKGRYSFRAEQMLSVVGLIGATTLAAMGLVLDGQKTWRDAGCDAAEFVLRAIGIRPKEARALATRELPPLAERDDEPASK